MERAASHQRRLGASSVPKDHIPFPPLHRNKGTAERERKRRTATRLFSSSLTRTNNCGTAVPNMEHHDAVASPTESVLDVRPHPLRSSDPALWFVQVAHVVANMSPATASEVRDILLAPAEEDARCAYGSSYTRSNLRPLTWPNVETNAETIGKHDKARQTSGATASGETEIFKIAVLADRLMAVTTPAVATRFVKIFLASPTPSQHYRRAEAKGLFGVLHNTDSCAGTVVSSVTLHGNVCHPARNRETPEPALRATGATCLGKVARRSSAERSSDCARVLRLAVSGLPEGGIRSAYEQPKRSAVCCCRFRKRKRDEARALSRAYSDFAHHKMAASSDGMLSASAAASLSSAQRKPRKRSRIDEYFASCSRMCEPLWQSCCMGGCCKMSCK
ncbi:hypothetical protein HPB50_004331 [Hyalomma asiaticum]|uniref:Uncharacterized protein n=1 Tax=Hyalomma asiaticum TaxID=266040 RepID=A0ACB7SKK5_HYAAI|nr:hypothetical protein HPB50_004331 [Hyalomma asiaticum]